MEQPGQSAINQPAVMEPKQSKAWIGGLLGLVVIAAVVWFFVFKEDDAASDAADAALAAASAALAAASSEGGCKDGEEMVGTKCLVKCTDGQIRVGEVCQVASKAASKAAASKAAEADSASGGGCKADEEMIGTKCLVKCTDGKIRVGEVCAAEAARWRVEPNSWVANWYRWREFTPAEMANPSPQLCMETCDAEKEDYGCAGFGYDKDGQRGCYLFEPGSTYISDKPEDIAGSYDAYLRGSAV